MEDTTLFYSCILASLVLFLIWICQILVLKPEIRRVKLRKQGLGGPSPSLLLGNTPEMMFMIASTSETATQNSKKPLLLDYSCTLFPHFMQWAKQYGKTFTFALGGEQVLYVADPNLVREINLYTSLDLGKPTYLQKDRGALLGKGVTTTNGAVWSHQRKTIVAQLYMGKVMDMQNVMVESASALVKSWETMIETEGEVADIRVDDHVRTFTSQIISKMMFGNDYDKGIELLAKCRDLINSMGGASTLGVPLLRFIPTKKNRDAWRLSKEIHSMIMDIAKKRTDFGSYSADMLQVILEASKNGELGPSTPDEFIVDNMKDVYLAAVEVTALAAVWGLMLLALHPEWQARARSEVLEICQGRVPDSNMIGKMKVLKMVILEVLRLYPVGIFVSRQALQDVKLGDLSVPKGVNIWIWMPALHRDPELWGPNANDFNPERFANGVSGACKSPQAYAPFGVGSRVCPGQNLAMTELKILFALVLSNFNLAISPNYHHSPQFGVLLRPEHGVNLLVRKLRVN